MDKILIFSKKSIFCATSTFTLFPPLGYQNIKQIFSLTIKFLCLDILPSIKRPKTLKKLFVMLKMDHFKSKNPVCNNIFAHLGTF